MPFIPKPYPLGTVFEVGRRIKLADNKRTTYKTAPTTAAKAALAASSYRGDKDAVTYNGDGQFRPAGGAQGIIVRSDAHTSDVLVIWRDQQNVECALVWEVPADAFVTHRGASRFAGEPNLTDYSATSSSPAPAMTATKTAAPSLNVNDALETLRQALQPNATVDQSLVESLVEQATQPLRDRIDQLEQLLQTPATQQTRARLAIAAAASSSPIMAALQERYVVGQEAPANALLCAPPSLGKSFTIREFGKQYDLYLEHGCTDDLDEVATLLGGPVPDGSGFLMADGVLTQAVRAAAAGQNVLLLLDEVLRLGDRPQETLLSFLTGVKTDAGRVYRLRTRRVDNGALEVIECPTSRLHIVAAANLGPRHPQDAFWSRWDVVRFGFDQKTVEGVAHTVVESYGITYPQLVAARFTQALVASRNGVQQNLLRYPLDIRTLERACQLAGSDNGKEVLRYIAKRVADVCAHWSIDLGETDAQSRDAANAIATMLTNAL